MLLNSGKYALPRAWTSIRSVSRQHSNPSTFVRLLSSLALLEQRNGKLEHSSLSAVTAAQKIGGSVVGFVAGSGIRAVAEEASKVKGLEKVIIVDNGAYDRV